jgi:hypothetical protein
MFSSIVFQGQRIIYNVLIVYVTERINSQMGNAEGEEESEEKEKEDEGE